MIETSRTIRGTFRLRMHVAQQADLGLISGWCEGWTRAPNSIVSSPVARRGVRCACRLPSPCPLPTASTLLRATALPPGRSCPGSPGGALIGGPEECRKRPGLHPLGHGLLVPRLVGHARLAVLHLVQRPVAGVGGPARQCSGPGRPRGAPSRAGARMFRTAARPRQRPFHLGHQVAVVVRRGLGDVRDVVGGYDAGRACATGSCPGAPRPRATSWCSPARWRPNAGCPCSCTPRCSGRRTRNCGPARGAEMN